MREFLWRLLNTQKQAQLVTAASRRQRAKRAFELAMCVLTTPLMLPLFGLIAVAILAFDGGDVLFRKQRIGRKRRAFCIYKFRIMRAEQVSGIGRLLRMTGLDETAHWINVLRGEMSWIGPRPLTQKDLVRLGWNSAAHDPRFEVTPGITGLAQLYGGVAANWTRGIDRLYRREQCLRLDLWIAILSLAVTLLGKRRVSKFLLHREPAHA